MVKQRTTELLYDLFLEEILMDRDIVIPNLQASSSHFAHNVDSKFSTDRDVCLALVTMVH